MKLLVVLLEAVFLLPNFYWCGTIFWKCHLIIQNVAKMTRSMPRLFSWWEEEGQFCGEVQSIKEKGQKFAEKHLES